MEDINGNPIVYIVVDSRDYRTENQSEFRFEVNRIIIDKQTRTIQIINRYLLSVQN